MDDRISNPTREQLLNKLANKKVQIKYGEAFKNGISECLEEILGVSKETLSPELSKEFDKEVDYFHSYVPACLSKCHRDKRLMKRKYSVYFNTEIVLRSTEVCILL